MAAALCDASPQIPERSTLGPCSPQSAQHLTPDRRSLLLSEIRAPAEPHLPLHTAVRHQPPGPQRRRGQAGRPDLFRSSRRSWAGTGQAGDAVESTMTLPDGGIDRGVLQLTCDVRTLNCCTEQGIRTAAVANGKAADQATTRMHVPVGRALPKHLDLKLY